ncbi:MAG: FAD-dependent oxidoreductase [Eubacteriales bacterium]|nr:FAD-dependent oxidoreductase [Eubacteriales bacterium]
MKIIIIGANHAGIAAANTLLDSYPGHQIIMIDRNSNLSYLGCGTALWVGRQIDSWEKLFYTSRENFVRKGADIRMETTVTHIDFAKKTVSCENKNGHTCEESYDRLILATGSLPVSPGLPGSDLDGILFLKLFQDGQKADQRISDPAVNDVAVIGAGYIGVEIAEAARRRGKSVRLFDVAPTCLAGYYDPEFTSGMEKLLRNEGIRLHFNEAVTAFRGGRQVEAVVTDQGEYPADLVISAIGFQPNTALGREHLDCFRNGAYRVDRRQRTSDPNVYAAGDCAAVYSNALQAEAYIALATNAVRSGIVAAHNIGGTPLASAGVQGSSAISVFGYNMVSTGLSVSMARRNGMKVSCTDFEDLQRPGFMKRNASVKIRIVYETDSRRIVGAQLASSEDISMAIHMFSLAIQENITIDQLKLLDIFFLPHFNQPYNYITMAALGAK